MNSENIAGALVQLRAYIAQGEFARNDRLPPERKLCQHLGVSRSELRRAFTVLESEGAIWRHVGRGTFIGDGPGSGEHPSIMITVVVCHVDKVYGKMQPKSEQFPE